MSNRAARGDDGKRYSFRNLLLWQKGQDLASDVIKLTEQIPDTPAGRTLIRQLVGSAGSVPANIAEGHGRFSKAAYRNHLSIARGSICEVETWLDLLLRAGYVDQPAVDTLIVECHDILAGLTSQMKALSSALNKRSKADRVSDQFVEYVTDDEMPDDITSEEVL